MLDCLEHVVADVQADTPAGRDPEPPYAVFEQGLGRSLRKARYTRDDLPGLIHKAGETHVRRYPDLARA